MTVVNSKEFKTNQKKYFDMAVNGDVCIKSDKYMFYLICQPVDMIDEQVALQPDDDFRRAITKEQLLEHIYECNAKRFSQK